MTGRGGFWCCCGCYTFTDEFNEGTEPNPSDWEVCSGDWDIDGGHLTTSDTGAIITLLHKMAEDVGILTTYIHIRDATGGTFTSVGAVYQILVFYGNVDVPCNSNSHWLVELEIIDNNTGELRLYDPSNTLVDYRAMDFTGQDTTILTVCVAFDAITVYSDEISGGPMIWDCPDPMNGYYFALGSGNSYPVYWETVFYSDHYDHDPTCPNCEVPCCCGCIEAERPTLTATIYAPGCSDMNGLDTTMSCGGVPGECCVWSTDDPFEFTCNGKPSVYKLEFQMECLNNLDGCDGYQLHLDWEPTGANSTWCDPADDDAETFPSSECDCKPLNITFGPFRLWVLGSHMDQTQCNCCQEFWVVITE